MSGCVPQGCLVVPGDQKRALDTPELELWMIVSCHVGTESLKLKVLLESN